MSTSVTLDQLIQTPPRSKLTTMARWVMGGLGIAIFWAFIMPLEEVSVANGEVVPQEQIQTIQHLEGGIVEKIHVQEGTRVKQGEPLMQLNITSFVANEEELKVNLEGMRLKRIRLTAESRGITSLNVEAMKEKFRESLVNSEIQVYHGNMRRLQSNLSVLQEQVQQKELEVAQLQAEKRSIAKNLVVLQEKLKISTDLIRDQLTSRLDHLQLETEVEELSGRNDILKIAIPRAEAALKESREKYENETITYQNDALEQLREVELEIARSQEMMTRATDQVLRTTIKSPIDGIVKSLENNTLGGVVRPGEVIMEIVPQTENLVIETKLDPKDVGFVEIGQEALVKLETYDYMRFGGLNGEVIAKSADAYTDEKTGDPYFKVVIRTDKNFLGDDKTQLPITPGMQATADIKTGSKTVMQYLLKPVLKVGTEAFRER